MALTGTPDTFPESHAPALNAIDWIALVLLIVGGLNWALVGLADFDLVAALFGEGTTPTRAIYALVGLAALWSIYTAARLAARRS